MCVFVREREIERERERVCVCERERGREREKSPFFEWEGLEIVSIRGSADNCVEIM